MMLYVLTQQAAKDVVEITTYTARRWGAAQADAYGNALIAAFEKITDDPFTPASIQHDAILFGYRSLIVQKHRILYRMSGQSTQILRILHQRMHVSRHAIEAED
jgi:plasmid stabilization system protein ParE